MIYLRRIPGQVSRQEDAAEILFQGNADSVDQLVFDGLGAQHSAYVLYISNLTGDSAKALRPIINTSTDGGSSLVTGGYVCIKTFFPVTQDTYGATTHVTYGAALVISNTADILTATSGGEISTETWWYGIGSASVVTRFEGYYTQARNVTGVEVFRSAGSFGTVTSSNSAVENALVYSCRNITTETPTSFSCNYTLVGYKR